MLDQPGRDIDSELLARERHEHPAELVGLAERDIEIEIGILRILEEVEHSRKRVAPKRRIPAQLGPWKVRDIGFVRARLGLVIATGLLLKRLHLLVQRGERRFLLGRLIRMEGGDRQQQAENTGQPAGPLEQAHLVQLGDRPRTELLHEPDDEVDQPALQLGAFLVRRRGKDRFGDPLRLKHHLGRERRRRLDHAFARAKRHRIEQPHLLGDGRKCRQARQRFLDHPAVGPAGRRGGDHARHRRPLEIEGLHRVEQAAREAALVVEQPCVPVDDAARGFRDRQRPGTAGELPELKLLPAIPLQHIEDAAIGSAEVQTEPLSHVGRL